MDRNNPVTKIQRSGWNMLASPGTIFHNNQYGIRYAVPAISWPGPRAQTTPIAISEPHKARRRPATAKRPMPAIIE